MNNKKLNKKEIKALIYQKIETALSDIAGALNKKDFGKKLQKASALLAKDIAKATKKKASKKGKSKKITSESGKMNPVKMNNLPVTSEITTGSENITP